MEPKELLKALVVAERLKDTTRHCYTSKGRRESVAEHSWMMTLMAFFMKNEFPEADINKVIQMCIIHDLGECFTGDIPAFEKTKEHEETEEKLLNDWIKSLPESTGNEMRDLYKEMKERQTVEAKIYKAIDGVEAVIQHNFSDISTWSENEFELNLTYADDKVQFSEYLSSLREKIRNNTIEKCSDKLQKCDMEGNL